MSRNSYSKLYRTCIGEVTGVYRFCLRLRLRLNSDPNLEKPLEIAFPAAFPAFENPFFTDFNILRRFFLCLLATIFVNLRGLFGFNVL